MVFPYPYYFEARTYNSSGKVDPYHCLDRFYAYAYQPSTHIKSFNELRKHGNAKLLVGYLSYESNRSLEKLSHIKKPLEFPEIDLFEPESYQFGASEFQEDLTNFEVNWIKIPQPDFKKKEYLQTVKQLKKHLQAGDIYEITFCIQLIGKVAIDKPYAFFNHLCKVNPNPFAALVKTGDIWIISASPERYIVKRDDVLASQPIKGTAGRDTNLKLDAELKSNLLKSEKERAENVMIVDLVRNDLSRIAKKGSVHVPELFGVHSFPSVHQLISTVECKVKPDLEAYDIFKASFPPGSMTGAPKISAMNLINQYEKNNRGPYSGSIGYIMPNGDMDFNVVIRSIIYNEKTGEIRIPIGGAITIKSDPEQEYNECKIKALASLKALHLNLEDIKWE